MYPGLLSLRVMLNLLTDNAFLGVAAIGVTFVILSGGIDLSVGAMIGCTGVMLAKMLESHAFSGAAAVAIVLAFGCAVGAVHGRLISSFRLPPFLVTLAGMFACRGIALAISRESVSISEPLVVSIAEFKMRFGRSGSLTSSAMILLALLIVGVFVLRQMRFGRTTLAIGGGESSALLMGLAVGRTKFWIYVVSGLCSALGGVVFCLYTLSGNAVAGTGLELDAIAAVVIGGAALTGGYGSVIGTFFGVMTLGLVQTILTFDGRLSSWWTKIFVGSLFLLFVLMRRPLESQHSAQRANL